MFCQPSSLTIAYVLCNSSPTNNLSPTVLLGLAPVWVFSQTRRGSKADLYLKNDEEVYLGFLTVGFQTEQNCFGSS